MKEVETDKVLIEECKKFVIGKCLKHIRQER